MSVKRYILVRISGVIGRVWKAAPDNSLLIAFKVDSTCQSSSGKGTFMALCRNLIEVKIFLIELYPIVADSSLAKAIRVSLLVGQTGFPNLTQKRMNCLRLLLWLRLVPSAYILAWESLAFSKSWLKWSSAG